MTAAVPGYYEIKYYASTYCKKSHAVHIFVEVLEEIIDLEKSESQEIIEQIEHRVYRRLHDFQRVQD